MKMPCELIAEPYVVKIRKYTTQNLRNKGLTQKEIANLLHISQALVSSYLKTSKEKTQHEPENIFDKVARQVAHEVSETLLVHGQQGIEQAISSVCKTCKLMRAQGPSCALHFMIVPELQKENSICQACHSNQNTVQLLQEDRYHVIRSLQHAVQTMAKIQSISELVPEIGLQFLYSIENPKSNMDVAGFPGRIGKHREKLVRIANPEFAASNHSSKILIEVNKYVQNVRSLITIKTSNKLEDQLSSIGVSYLHLSFDTYSKRKIREKLESQTLSVPIAFLGEPAIGIEAITYLVASNPADIISILEKISSFYQ